MKSPVAYYLLLLYITVMFKPLIPIISDTLEHSFNEAIHVSTVHAVYGDNHVEKEMAAASKDDTNKNQNGIKYEEPVPVHVSATAFLFTAFITNNRKPAGLFNLTKLAAIFLSQPLPPPKFSW